MGTVAHQRKLEEIYNFRHNSNRRSLGLYFLLSLLLYVSYYSEPLSLFGRNKLSNEYLPLGEKKLDEIKVTAKLKLPLLRSKLMLP